MDSQDLRIDESESRESASFSAGNPPSQIRTLETQTTTVQDWSRVRLRRFLKERSGNRMRRSRFSEEQIAFALRQAEKLERAKMPHLISLDCFTDLSLKAGTNAVEEDRCRVPERTNLQ
jgi:hypothetical protein